MVRFLLVLFDAVERPIGLLGVDYAQFRAILEAKLTMDTRRPMAGCSGHGQRSPRNALAGSLLIYAFFGLFVGMVPFFAKSPLVAMTVIHAFIMTMIGMSLIADFSSVLLDTTDNGIIRPRPVTGRTMLVARIAHIVTYLGLLGVSLSACTFVVGTIKYGIGFPFVFGATLVGSITLVVFVTHLFYLIAMRLMDAERFRDIILYFQIGMTVVMVGGYQIMPRLMDMKQLKTLTIDQARWIYLFPPAWMAAPIDLFTGHWGMPQLVLSILAVCVPMVSLLLVVLVLAPGFGRALAALEASPTGRTQVAAHGATRPSLACRLSHFACRKPTERAAFELAWQLGSRDRQFKLRTYPMFAFFFVWVFAMVLLDDKGVWATLAALPETNYHLLFLYFASMLIPTMIAVQKFSDHHEAAWAYRAFPVALPGEVLMGALKAILVRFMVPAYALISIAVVAVWGLSAVDDVVLALCGTLLTCALNALVLGRVFPFSQPYVASEGTGRVGKSFLMMFIPAVVGLSHYGLLRVAPILVPMAIPVVLFVALLALRTYARTPWSAVSTGA